MAVWGRVAPLRRNAPVLSVFVACEVLAVALAVAGNHGEAALVSCVGFGLSGFGSSMRLGWEERMAGRLLAAAPPRHAHSPDVTPGSARRARAAQPRGCQEAEKCTIAAVPGPSRCQESFFCTIFDIEHRRLPWPVRGVCLIISNLRV